MTDLYKKVSDARTGLEKLLSQLPGYKGYKEKEVRRESDKLLRQAVVTRMSGQHRRMQSLQRKLIGAGRIEYLDDLGMAVTQLQTFIDRVRRATYGYSGLFDAISVREEELDHLYDFDHQLLEYEERLSVALDALEVAIPGGEGLADALRAVQSICEEANDTFSMREEVILGGFQTTE